MQALANLLTPLIELMAGRRTTLGLLETFVGKRIGERILQGQVKRGDGEQISAAFWYSDLRGFTALSETLPTDQLLKLLNDYFEYCAAAAAPRGGEILQFIGDAILIVFEIKDPSTHPRGLRARRSTPPSTRSTPLRCVNNRRRRASHRRSSSAWACTWEPSPMPTSARRTGWRSTSSARRST